MKNLHKPVYSVVIPTYNEKEKEKELKDHLKSISEYFKSLGQSFEILIVLDGPTDGTDVLVRKEAKKYKEIKVIERKENKGKGFSIREGLMASNGQIRLFTDMDGATPINMLDRMTCKFQEGADVVIGSRRIDRNQIKVHQPKWKELLGQGGNILIQLLGGLWGVHDTQCGFKAFSERVVKDIVPRATIDRWGIDFELLMIAKKLDYNIVEVPVVWIDKGESLVGISGYFSTFKDLFVVRKNIFKGVYQLKKKIEEFDLDKKI